MKKRKTNYAKSVSHECRNNGSCPWCTGNRTHSNRKREPAPEEDIVAVYYCMECDMYFDNDYHPGHEDPRDSCAVLCPECYGDVVKPLEYTEQDVSEATEWADFDPDC